MGKHQCPICGHITPYEPPYDDGLKQPVRKFSETFSAVEVIKEMFFKSSNSSHEGCGG